jgi:hypothetical protein
MKKLIISLSILTTLLFGYEDAYEADCIILKDENSIICKYSHIRETEETKATFNWIEPNGVITRTRVMTIPAGHASIYDYRYLEGRTKGVWTFEVIEGEEKTTTQFTIE